MSRVVDGAVVVFSGKVSWWFIMEDAVCVCVCMRVRVCGGQFLGKATTRL